MTDARASLSVEPSAAAAQVAAAKVEPWRVSDVLALLVRCFLGGYFIYMGLHKALHPVEFLKLLRQYEVLHPYLLLNFVASTLPWFEIFCGLLLVLGVAVRGT